MKFLVPSIKLVVLILEYNLLISFILYRPSSSTVITPLISGKYFIFERVKNFRKSLVKMNEIV